MKVLTNVPAASHVMIFDVTGISQTRSARQADAHCANSRAQRGSFTAGSRWRGPCGRLALYAEDIQGGLLARSVAQFAGFGPRASVVEIEISLRQCV